MEYIISGLGFVATCLAIFGKTFDETHGTSFWRRILPLGYLTAAVALGALIASVATIRERQVDANVRAEFALQSQFDRSTAIGEKASHYEYVARLLNRGGDPDAVRGMASSFALSIKQDVDAILSNEKTLRDQVLTGGSDIPIKSLSDLTLFRGGEDSDSVPLALFDGRNFDLAAAWAQAVEEDAAKLDVALCARSMRWGLKRLVDVNSQLCRSDGRQWSSAAELLERWDKMEQEVEQRIKGL